MLSFDGFMFGIGGVVTYKKSKLPDVLRSTVPLERIVVETDSPYLSPVPFRGTNGQNVALRIARIANPSRPSSRCIRKPNV